MVLQRKCAETRNIEIKFLGLGNICENLIMNIL